MLVLAQVVTARIDLTRFAGARGSGSISSPTGHSDGLISTFSPVARAA